MIRNLNDHRMIIALNVNLSLLGQLTQNIKRSLIRLTANLLSLLNRGLSLNLLALNATTKLIGRGLKIQRTRTLTLNTNQGRRNNREHDRASTSNKSLQLGRIRNIGGHRTKMSLTAKQVSMRQSVLLNVLTLGVRRLNGGRVNTSKISLLTRRSSTIIRRTQVSVMTTLTTQHLLSGM